MRIFIITTPLPTAWQANSLGPLVDQIRSLRDVGIEIDVLEITGRTPLKYLRGIWQLWSRLSNVDIVHGHHGYCGWVARAQFMRPVVVSFMGEDALGMSFRSPLSAAYSRLVAWLNRGLARWVDATIVKSEEMKDALTFDAAHVISNGVDTAQFRPIDQLDCRATLGWSPDGLYLLFGANPNNPRKNFALAESVVQKVEELMVRNATIVPLRDVNHEQVPLYMNACDAMIFTSKLEGSPNVVKEAMACNLPIVSVPVADVPWLFADAHGYKIGNPIVSTLATLLVEILNDDRAFVNGAEALQQKELTLQAAAAKVAAIYEDVLRSSKWGE